MKAFLQLTFILAISINLTYAEESDPRVKAVQNYILKGDDYPEVFKDKEYKMKIQGLAVGDLDMDGVDEVVLHIKPHYLQSPTIIIYHVDKNLKVTRSIEGLAPGPLKEISGDHLDSHTFGYGADLEIESKNKKHSDDESFTKAALEHMGAVVRYNGWYHIDGRSGKKTYIDMRHVEVPEDRHTCAHFEFSEVDVIKIMGRKDDQRNYLLVKVGKTIYTYRFDRFLDNGLIEKEVSTLNQFKKST